MMNDDDVGMGGDTGLVYSVTAGLGPEVGGRISNGAVSKSKPAGSRLAL